MIKLSLKCLDLLEVNFECSANNSNGSSQVIPGSFMDRIVSWSLAIGTLIGIWKCMIIPML